MVRAGSFGPKPVVLHCFWADNPVLASACGVTEAAWGARGSGPVSKEGSVREEDAWRLWPG